MEEVSEEVVTPHNPTAERSTTRPNLTAWRSLASSSRFSMLSSGSGHSGTRSSRTDEEKDIRSRQQRRRMEPADPSPPLLMPSPTSSTAGGPRSGHNGARFDSTGPRYGHRHRRCPPPHPNRRQCAPHPRYQQCATRPCHCHPCATRPSCHLQMFLSSLPTRCRRAL